MRLKVYFNGHAYLRVPTGYTVWIVHAEKDSGVGGILSGRATTCPCSNEAGPSRKMGWDWWQYAVNSVDWKTDADIKLTCH